MLNLAELFGLAFMQRAFAVGMLISLCASLLGVCLVLKRYSMIGDGLSHVGFGALAIATALGAAPLVVTIPIVVIVAFLLLQLSESGKIKGDAAIAMLSTGSLAVGVTVLSLRASTTSDIGNYLFGSILTMSTEDVWLSAMLAAAVGIIFFLFYRQIFSITFDETFAKATGEKTRLYQWMLAFLTAVTIVLGMRVMGAMLISSLVTFPALTAMLLCKSFRSTCLCAMLISIICFLIGLLCSYQFSTPTGASVVIANIVVFALFNGMRWARGRVWG